MFKKDLKKFNNTHFEDPSILFDLRMLHIWNDAGIYFPKILNLYNLIKDILNHLTMI